MNILFVVPYSPSPIRVRSYNLIKSLLALGHNITLLYLVEKEFQPDQLINSASLKATGFNLPKWRSMLNCLQAFPSRLPLQAVYSWSNQLKEDIQLFISQQNFDVVHVEHLRGAKYALMVKSQYRIPVVWDSVDSITHLFRQTQKNHPKKLLRWLIKFELQRTEKFEKLLATKFNKLLVTSPKDQEEFLKLSPTSPVEVVTNGVDLDYFYPIPLQERLKNVILLSGKMSYHANVDMALFTITKIMPFVWQINDDIELWVVGKDPPPVLLQYSDHPKIKITGTVPEILPYLQKSTLALAPLNYGAGVQNKVLEAMACGIPVIASPLAVSALTIVNGEQVMIGEDAQHYAELILKVLSDPKTAQKIGKAGRTYVEKEHSWKRIGQKLENIYYETIESNSK